MKRQYRYVVVDVPPILHAGTLYMLAHSHTVLLVANLYDLTTAGDTKKLLDAIKGSYVPPERIRVVLNRVSRENQLRVPDLEKAFGQSVVGPDSERRPDRADLGKPGHSVHDVAPGQPDRRGRCVNSAVTLTQNGTEAAEPVRRSARPGGLRAFLANCFAN